MLDGALIGSDVAAPGVFHLGKAAGREILISARAVDAASNKVQSSYRSLSVGSLVRINFQPEDVAIPTGHLMDYRQGFKKHANGKSYGWSEADDFEEVALIPGSNAQRTDTSAHLGEETWEIAVQNGTYEVSVTIGAIGSAKNDQSLIIEGAIVDGSAQQDFIDATITVEVLDGRLSVRAAPECEQARICSLSLKPALIQHAIAKSHYNEIMRFGLGIICSVLW